MYNFLLAMIFGKTEIYKDRPLRLYLINLMSLIKDKLITCGDLKMRSHRIELSVPVGSSTLLIYYSLIVNF